MAFRRQKPLEAATQARLVEMAAEMRQLLYGATGCPEWGTKFTEIEADGMSLGLELARLVMEQSVTDQAQQMPKTALAVPDDEVLPAGTTSQAVDTEAGVVEWPQPQGYQKRGRRAFFPASPGAGSDGR